MTTNLQQRFEKKFMDDDNGQISGLEEGLPALSVDCEDILAFIAQEFELAAKDVEKKQIWHKHNSISTFTSYAEEGCIYCNNNMGILDAAAIIRNRISG